LFGAWDLSFFASTNFASDKIRNVGPAREEKRREPAGIFLPARGAGTDVVNRSVFVANTGLFLDSGSVDLGVITS
jgi:hypothetical protein